MRCALVVSDASSTLTIAACSPPTFTLAPQPHAARAKPEAIQRQAARRMVVLNESMPSRRDLPIEPLFLHPRIDRAMYVATIDHAGLAGLENDRAVVTSDDGSSVDRDDERFRATRCKRAKYSS